MRNNYNRSFDVQALSWQVGEEIGFKSRSVKLNSSLELKVKEMLHDLRSPLSVVNLLKSQILGSNNEGAEVLFSAIDQIEWIANRALVLEATSQETNILDIDQFVEAVDQLVEAKKLEHSTSHAIIFRCAPIVGSTKMCGQLPELMSILSNLVNNSVESSELGGLISIHLLRKSDQIYVGVRDFGVGLSDTQLSKFNKGDFQSTKASHRGLALPSANRYISSLGGKLVFKNLPKGLEVGIEIPIILK